MSAASSKPTIAYLAQGQIRIKAADQPPRTMGSAYGDSIREKQVRAQQKHSWKSAGGGGSPFSGKVLWGASAMSQDVPLAITSICAAREVSGLVYSLESGSLCALLEAAQLGAEERRLWNDNRMRIRHVAVSQTTGDMAMSVLHENGTANIGVKLNGESGIKELTEGDSFDTAPHWMPGEGRKIIFQSAGIGRNREGQFMAMGPFSIQQLDADTGDMQVLVEDPKHDFLAPKLRDDGSMLFIRRPHREGERMNPLRMIKDVLLFPFRLLYAIFHFLNFFSTIFTGKKLTTDTSAHSRQMDMKQMMIWGNLVQAQQPARDQDPSIDLVPKSWQLRQRGANGETKELASGVLAYDVAADGTVVFTNGNAVFLLHPDGRKEHILNERMIEQVFFVSCAA